MFDLETNVPTSIAPTGISKVSEPTVAGPGRPGSGLVQPVLPPRPAPLPGPLSPLPPASLAQGPEMDMWVSQRQEHQVSRACPGLLGPALGLLPPCLLRSVLTRVVTGVPCASVSSCVNPTGWCED